MEDRTRMFHHWTDLTKFCYKRYQNGLSCEGCQNDTENLCRRKPWNKNPYKIRNIKYAMLKTLANIGEPNMKICDHVFEYSHTIDKALPHGEIESIAVFKCKICGKEVDEYELKNNKFL